jgi:RimJ/RimL family protein N-acetyltransferase
MGLPSLVIVLADNQRGIADSLGREGIAAPLGWHAGLAVQALTAALAKLLSDESRRRLMSQRGRELVDGLGGERVVRALTGSGLRFRRVTTSDSRLIWEWAQDASVRAVSFSTEPIPWEGHVKWFEEKLTDLDCLFLIAENGQSREVGQIRYDLQGAEAVVSISLAPSARGKGYGTAMIAESAAEAFTRPGIVRLCAYTKPDNHASIRAFLKAGYSIIGGTEIKSQPAIEFVLTREEWVQP